MNAIEIKSLTKRYGQKMAVNDLSMTIPAGAIYGFIGENGSGKSTTEKLICGLIHQNKGSIKVYGKDHRNPEVRAGIGMLIEAPGCYPNISVFENLMLHAKMLGIKNAEKEIGRVLKLVRMEGAASNKFRNCSLGMKQRIGIAMALMGSPKLLVLDEPINGLDADGMRIMREILTDVTRDGECTVLISSHILGELEKIATHYGIIRKGKLLQEMTAGELEDNCPTYVAIMVKEKERAYKLLSGKFKRVETDEEGALRIYDEISPEEAVELLYREGVTVSEIKTKKVSLEEYYMNLMHGREAV